MIIWMLWSMLFAAFVAAASVAIDRVAALIGAPRRYIWIAGIAIGAVLPVLLATHRPRPITDHLVESVVPADPSQLGGSGQSTPSDQILPSSRSGAASTVVVPPTSAAATLRQVIARAAASAAGADAWAERLWLLVSLALMVLFARAMRSLGRRSARWRETEVGSCRALLSPDAGPAVIGFARPRIVIPEWALSLDRSARELMLRHEMEHIRAGDPRTLFAAGFLLVAFPWNVALWWMVGRLRLAMELDCDARVIRAVGGPRAYGLVLLTVSERFAAPLPLAASLAEPRPLLERRIKAMLMPRPRRPLLASLPFAVAAVLAVTAASKAPRPAPLPSITSSHAMPAIVRPVVRAPVPSVATTVPAGENADVPPATATRAVVGDVIGGDTAVAAAPDVHSAIAPVPARPALPAPDCDALRTIITANFADVMRDDDVAAPGPRHPRYLVLIYDANNNFQRGIPGEGSVGIRVGGDTRPDSERPSHEQSAKMCGRPIMNGQPMMGGGGGGRMGSVGGGASAGGIAGGALGGGGMGGGAAPGTATLRRVSGDSVVALGALAASLPGMTFVPPAAGGAGGGFGGRAMAGTDSSGVRGGGAGGGFGGGVMARIDTSALGGRVSNITVMGLDGRGGQGSGTVALSIACGQTPCNQQTPCCAPWHSTALPAGSAFIGLTRQFLDDHSSDSYIIGLEDLKRGPPPNGEFSIIAPNEATGLTPPVRDSSGIAGIPASAIASVDELRFAIGQLEKQPVYVLIVTLAPASPRK